MKKLSPEEKRVNATVRSIRAMQARVQREEKRLAIRIIGYFQKQADYGDTHSVRVLATLNFPTPVPYAHACRCITGPEWSGSPNPKNPDNEWVCDDCGRVIKAEAS